MSVFYLIIPHPTFIAIQINLENPRRNKLLMSHYILTLVIFFDLFLALVVSESQVQSLRSFARAQTVVVELVVFRTQSQLLRYGMQIKLLHRFCGNISELVPRINLLFLAF